MLKIEDSSGATTVDDQRITKLFALGFDLSRLGDDGYVRVGCSQCVAEVICGIPCHEHGCCNRSEAHRRAEGRGEECDVD